MSSAPIDHAVFINGQACHLPQACSIEALLHQYGFVSSVAAVALNQQVVSRQSFADTAVQAGDRLEVVMPMQGG